MSNDTIVTRAMNLLNSTGSRELTTDAHSLTNDTPYHLLQNERRRRIIHHLHTRGDTSIGQLATKIAAIENDTAEGLVSGDQRKRVYIGLHQHHLPKLDEEDVVDWDEQSGSVEALERCAGLYEAMRVLDGCMEDHHE